MDLLSVIPIAALVSAFVTLIFRWFDRPRSMLTLEAQLTESPSLPQQAGNTAPTQAVLFNAGDGDAYDLRVFGSKTDPAFKTESGFWTYRLPVLRGGASIPLVVGMSTNPADLEDAAVILTWSPRPRRGWRRRQRFELTDFGLEEMLPPGLLPVETITPHVRRLVTLESLSPRARMYTQRNKEPHPNEVTD